MPYNHNMCILLPVVKLTIHVVVVNLNDSTFYFNVHNIFVRKRVFTPLNEVIVDSLAECIAVFVLTCNLIMFLSIEGYGFSDGEVHYVFFCVTWRFKLRSLYKVSELNEDLL